MICWKGKDIREFKNIYNRSLGKKKKKKSKLVEHIYLRFTSLMDKTILLLLNLHLMLIFFTSRRFFTDNSNTELNVNREPLLCLVM